MTRLQAKTLVRIAVMLVAGAALLVFGVGAVVQAGDGFSTKTIAGTWAALGTGELAAGAPAPLPEGAPVVTEGLFFFEEDGACDRTLVTNVGGLTSASGPLTDCSVVVDPNGTGTITLISASPLSPVVFDFVIVDNDELLGISEGPAVASFVMKRQME